ncbi:O-antigen flippase Wzx [Fulvivirga imtechensis AK7]|uniref:O-antigen flippase Wzx n=1 Tax=Fulvivirga imtechensis AK7 TaxID=1237149 RepID=L8JSB2_9BACT|nr:oligosaccharide flippase family protein [Fulvivirga imtechensis]ELR70379.1 O-antigen flippase Wzx [Fulvivirga imtechensis AK7]
MMLRSLIEIGRSLGKKLSGPFLMDIGRLGVGNLFAVIISFIGYPILARLYSDLEFGEFALFQSVFLVLVFLSSLNYQEALLLIKSKTQFTHLLNGLILVIIGFSLLITFFISFSGFSFLGINLNQHHIWLLPITVMLGAFAQIGHYAFLRQKKFKFISLVKIVERIIFLSTAILLAITKVIHSGLIWGLLAGRFAAFSISLCHITPKQFRITKQFRKILCRHRNFLFYALPGGLLERISRHLPIIIISTLAGKIATGQYAMAYKILTLPELVIGASIGQVFYQRASKKFLSNRKLLPIIIQTWGLQFMLGIIPLVVIVFFGDYLFAFFLGDSWLQAGEIAKILGVMLFAMFVSTPTSSILNILNKQHIGLVFGIIVLATRSVSLVIGLKLFALDGALWTFVITEIVVIIAFNLFLLKFTSNWDNQLT